MMNDSPAPYSERDYTPDTHGDGSNDKMSPKFSSVVCTVMIACRL